MQRKFDNVTRLSTSDLIASGDRWESQNSTFGIFSKCKSREGRYGVNYASTINCPVADGYTVFTYTGEAEVNRSNNY